MSAPLCRNPVLRVGGLGFAHAIVGAVAREEEHRNHGGVVNGPGHGIDVRECRIIVHGREHLEDERDAQQARPRNNHDGRQRRPPHAAHGAGCCFVACRHVNAHDGIAALQISRGKILSDKRDGRLRERAHEEIRVVFVVHGGGQRVQRAARVARCTQHAEPK